MAWEPRIFKDLHQIPREEHVFPGTPLCAGCGGLESLRLAAKVLGSRVVYVDAAGCMTNLAAFPFTPLDASWLYTTMGSAPISVCGKVTPSCMRCLSFGLVPGVILPSGA